MERLSRQGVETALSKAMHPEINYSLVKLGMIKNVEVSEGVVSLTLVLPFLNIPIKDDLIRLVKGAISKLGKNVRVGVKISEMSEEEREKFLAMAREGWML